MSNTRYLELTSEYRNRNQYALPAQFTIEMAQSGTRDRYNALDPVSDQAVSKIWTGSFDNSASSASVAVTGVVTTNSTTSPVKLLITTASGDLRTETNFYAGAILQLTDGVDVARRRILDYEFIDAGDTGIVTVESAYPDAMDFTATTGNIQNPSNATDTVRPSVFVPSAPNIGNYYINLYIINRTRQQYRQINEFIADSRLAVLDSTAATWTGIDDYTLSRALPTFGGYASSAAPQFVAVNALGRHFQIASTASSTANFYAGGFLRIDSDTAGALPSAPFSTLSAPYNQSRRIVQYLGIDTALTAVSGSTFTLASVPTGTGINEQSFIGSFITTAVSTYQILTFTLSTRTGTTTVAFGAEAVGDAVTMRTVIIASQFTTIPTTSTRYQIEAFTRDNYVPFVYSGSLVSQNEMVCYEVELINLILPNIVVNVGNGGRIAFYPYVYVELQNVSGASAGNTNIIYSNNPNSTRMTFRAAIDDTPTPLISPFIKIDGDGMVQTIKFKPNDTLQFSVRLPYSGDIFSVIESESLSPDRPNPLIQISALFSLKRV